MAEDLRAKVMMLSVRGFMIVLVMVLDCVL